MKKGNSLYEESVKRLVLGTLNKLVSLHVYNGGVIADTPDEAADKIIAYTSAKQMEKAGVDKLSRKVVLEQLAHIVATSKSYKFTGNAYRKEKTKKINKELIHNGSAAKRVQEEKIFEQNQKNQFIGTVTLNSDGLCVLALDDKDLNGTYLDLVQDNRTKACLGKRVGASVIKGQANNTFHTTYQVDICFDYLKNLTPLERRDVELLYKYERPMFYLQRTKKPFVVPMNEEEKVLYAECAEAIKCMPTTVTQEKLVEMETKFANFKDDRAEQYFTCDPAETGDVDDAICVHKTLDGYKVKVGIALVGEYVKKNNPLFEYARIKGMSDYPAGLVNAMLDGTLSNGICSINEGVDRLALAGEFDLDESGNLKSYNFYPAIINSKLKASYKQVDKVHEGDKEVRSELSKQLLQTIDDALELESMLRPLRERQGEATFITRDNQFIVDDECRSFKAVLQENDTYSHKTVETYMIMYNTCMADFCAKNDIPILYRREERITEDHIEKVKEFCDKIGIPFTFDGDYSDYNKIQVQLSNIVKRAKKMHLKEGQKENKLFAQYVSEELIKMLPPAYYSAQVGEHFALGLDTYSHATSPIRRLPDLIMQINVLAFMQGVPVSELPFQREELEQIADDVNKIERNVDKMSMEEQNQNAAIYIKSVLVDKGYVYENGYVSRAQGENLVIVTPLTDIYCEHAPTTTIGSGKSGNGLKVVSQFKVGQEIKVNVTKADVHNGKIYGSVIKDNPEKRREFDLVR